MSRESWDSYFMRLAVIVASRATCDRANVGCVLVRDNRIVSTGYNGSVSGAEHCDDVGHIMREGHCIATVHAELNAILYCALEGVSTKDTTAYITHFPCLNCSKALIQAGVRAIYYQNAYRIDDYALKLLRNANILIHKMSVEEL